MNIDEAYSKIENCHGFDDTTSAVGEAWERVKVEIATLQSQLAASEKKHRDIYYKTAHEVEQILGKALGYPWFKDDLKNFPDATEADGVCVGEHVPETIAAAAANRIKKLEAQLAASQKREGILREGLVEIGNGTTHPRLVAAVVLTKAEEVK